jgi:hypothetical protein
MSLGCSSSKMDWVGSAATSSLRRRSRSRCHAAEQLLGCPRVPSPRWQACPCVCLAPLPRLTRPGTCLTPSPRSACLACPCIRQGHAADAGTREALRTSRAVRDVVLTDRVAHTLCPGKEMTYCDAQVFCHLVRFWCRSHYSTLVLENAQERYPIFRPPPPSVRHRL